MSAERDARAWLVELLATDPTLAANAPAGVYFGVAPPQTPHPNIVVTATDAQHTRTADRQKAMTSGTWRIVVWSAEDTPTAAVAAAVERIEELLDRTTDTHNGTTISVVAESSHTHTAVSDGDLFHAEGGWFRFWAH